MLIAKDDFVPLAGIVTIVARVHKALIAGDHVDIETNAGVRELPPIDGYRDFEPDGTFTATVKITPKAVTP